MTRLKTIASRDLRARGRRLGPRAGLGRVRRDERNTGNSFQAAGCFNMHRMATGSYTGDGSDGRAISVGFQPDLVIVKADTNQIGVARSESMTGDASKPITGATNLSTNRIESLTATGFTVGTNAQVNGAGTTYRWVAMRAGCAMYAGSYAGNGAASRTIAGVGFQPELVVVMPGANTQASHRFAGMTRSYPVLVEHGHDHRDHRDGRRRVHGRELGRGQCQRDDLPLLAFNDVAGSSLSSTYAGNGADNRNIGGVGFQPDYLLIRANDTATARAGHHRPASLTGTASQFWNNTANSTNGIQAIQATGFQVGTDTSVNANGPTYHFMAFRNTG